MLWFSTSKMKSWMSPFPFVHGYAVHENITIFGVCQTLYLSELFSVGCLKKKVPNACICNIDLFIIQDNPVNSAERRTSTQFMSITITDGDDLGPAFEYSTCFRYSGYCFDPRYTSSVTTNTLVIEKLLSYIFQFIPLTLNNYSM